jgi:hypothetical protein
MIRRTLNGGPLLDDIRNKIEAARSVALPSSALSKACQYAIALWKRLTRSLEYPELELSPNLAENSMRPVASGSQELDAHRQSTGRTESCSDSLGRGKLPQVETSGDEEWADTTGVHLQPVVPAGARISRDKDVASRPRKSSSSEC